MKKVKFRIVVIAAAIATGSFVLQFVSRPIRAAQNAGTQAETPPTVDPRAAQDPGPALYAKRCAICHGDQREGNLPGFPPLVGIERRMADNKIAELVRTGKGRMPGFPGLQGSEMTALMQYLHRPGSASQTQAGGKGSQMSDVAEAGGALFHQNCAFCHGRDAMGGETGPDLTQSKLVLSDKTGEKIAAVIREGRPDNKMPGFNFSPQEIRSLIAFIHAREAEARAHPGGRRGVAPEDLQTGNAQAGKQYFEGAGGCAKCHSASGDLAGIARRYQGLQLEERMLYPRGAKSTVTVTLPSGEKVTGAVAYNDEFTIALRDATASIAHGPPAA